MSNTKTKWLVKTGLMTALLIVLQMLTKSFGQLVTGTCVNAVLAVSALAIGFSSGITVAILSPFFAFLLGIGPQLFPITPAIAVGNCALVIVLCLLCRNKESQLRGIIVCFTAAFAKFITLYLLVVQLLCNVLALPEKQVATFSVMFSWPQLITAFIGSFVSFIIVRRIKKIIK